MKLVRFSPGRRGSSVQAWSAMVGWLSRYSASSGEGRSRQRGRYFTVSRSQPLLGAARGRHQTVRGRRCRRCRAAPGPRGVHKLGRTSQNVRFAGKTEFTHPTGTSSCGPLVAQTSIRRLAQLCGSEVRSERKMPASDDVSRTIVAARPGARLGLSRRRSQVRVPSLP
jgi:hypothetical protein